MFKFFSTIFGKNGGYSQDCLSWATFSTGQGQHVSKIEVLHIGG
jgi:hypothetical protein